MRSARLLLATATATAALAIAAPGAFAADGGDWDHGDSSYSKEHDKDSKHDKPNGGMHTGGGALTAVNEGDWSKGDSADESKKGGWEADKEEAKGSWNSEDKEESSSKGDWGGKGEWGGKHEKPSGGMHTGGGALASPGVTAGGLAALAVVGAGAFAMRRRNAADGVS
ncbi:hypothetical protein [Streptomyces sp. NPDC047042]|uniref:hypothetical protein n=1 Tax=Streptomyces sp. NPDC047042 TaxID=3154807 RepID=UPI0033EA8CE0